ncbi:hypothetical protein IFM89_028247 [Coptis chinensis]|uniref:Uncharacterized protein n=1 Tax=Coptis chinensis TaxID=261450 RepID=A0A835IR09_9MAGN|nr:hypothetical protein IFM89_028247 [Coptis chinensis]
MSAKLMSSCLGIYTPLPNAPIHSQVFNGISLFVKFSHFTANQAIQEAFTREDRVHIIDLDIMQGLQCPGLFHILVLRPGGPPLVWLTGLGTNIEALEATRKRLSDFAKTLGLLFEFFPVAKKVGNLDPERLNVNRVSVLVVGGGGEYTGGGGGGGEWTEGGGEYIGSGGEWIGGGGECTGGGE